MALNAHELGVFTNASTAIRGLSTSGALIGSPRPYRSPNKPGKGLEFHALVSLFHSVVANGYIVRHIPSAGSRQIRIRTNPDDLTSSYRQYSYFELHDPSRTSQMGNPQIHCSINIYGGSQQSHEMDICIIWDLHAMQHGMRFTREPNAFNTLHTNGPLCAIPLAIECKFTLGGQIGRDDARAFVGRRNDAQITDAFFITNALSGASNANIAAKHTAEWQFMWNGFDCGDRRAKLIDGVGGVLSGHYLNHVISEFNVLLASSPWKSI